MMMFMWNFLFVVTVALGSLFCAGCVTTPGQLEPVGDKVPSSVEEPQGEIHEKSSYRSQSMHGWTVLVSPDLISEPELEDRTLALLDDHLYRIVRVVPSPALEHLRRVEIWVEKETPWTKCMCYHVSPEWLSANGYNPAKAGTVEVGNAEAFLDWTLTQPWMVLHELAHAYHYQVLGPDHPGINGAWRDRVAAGDFDQVLHASGDPRRHYALTNDKEYFAETTEAYFGTNDFHPFVRAELRRVDPRGYELMESTWYRPMDEPRS